MDKKHRKLSRSVAHFQEHIGSWAKDVQQGVASLKRVNDYGPSVGALEFKHALSELDEEVSELAQQTQHLERFTVDSQSMEELLGHCSQLYQSNRTGMQKLQAHLAQYGYQSPGPLQHPQNPLSLVHPVSGRADQAPGLGQHNSKEDNLPSSSARLAGEHHTPPTQAGTIGRKTRLHARQQTPGILTRDLPASEEDEEEEEDMELAELSFKHQLSGQEAEAGNEGCAAGAGDPSKQGKKGSMATLAPMHKATHNRHSLASSDSSTPEAFMSPSLAALQAKYGANAQAAQSSHAQMSAPDQAANNRSTIPGYPPDQARRDPGSKCSPAPEQLHISPPGRADQLGLSPPVVEDDTCNLYQQLIRSKDVPSSITAALSNSNSSSNNYNKGSVLGTSSSTNRAAMAAAATVTNAGGAGVRQAQGSRAAGEGGSMGGLLQQQQQQQAGAPPQARTTPPPLLRRSPRATEAMAAAKNQPLAAKLASLETMWVSSGQAARSPTPKRAQAALANAPALGSDSDSPTAVPPEVSREAQAMATRMSADFSSGNASHKLAAYGDVRSSTGSTALMNHSTRPQGSKFPLGSGASAAAAAAAAGPVGGSDFVFALVQPAVAPAHTGPGKPSTSHTTPAWPALYTGARVSSSSNPTASGEAAHHLQGAASSDPGHSVAPSSTLSAHSAHSTHITPAVDHQLLSKYASTSPLSTANLSPGTSSLLNRVFGSQHAQSGRSSGVSASGPASADCSGAGQSSKPLPFQHQPPLQPPAPHHPPQYSAPSTNPLPPPTQQSPALQPTEPATLSGARSSSTAAGMHPLTSHPLDRNSSLLRASSSTTVRSNSEPLTMEGGNSEGGTAVPNPAVAVVSPEAYAGLPMFLRSQLPLDLLNATVQGVATLLRQQDHDPRAVTMGELEGLGLDTQRSKVFVNALCKLGKAQMQGSSRFLCMPMG